MTRFKPAWWCHNAHVQTILPTILQRKPTQGLIWQTHQTADKDFVDLAWTQTIRSDETRPIVVLFHGLEGSYRSPYAIGMLNAIRKQGWIGVMMHFRGCSGRPNLLPRSYHSGETLDALNLLHNLHLAYPKAPIAAIGYSLGGNMLLKLLAENPGLDFLKAAAAVSAPLDLSCCAYRLQKGFSQVYQKHLLDRMKKNLRNKMTVVSYPQGFNPDIKKIKNFVQFDDLITAPLHGFNDASHYYQSASALTYLKQIQHRTLIIHAKDDPFMTTKVIPTEAQLSDNIDYEISEKGGHVGFVCGTIRHPKFWLEQRIPHWLKVQGQLQ